MVPRAIPGSLLSTEPEQPLIIRQCAPFLPANKNVTILKCIYYLTMFFQLIRLGSQRMRTIFAITSSSFLFKFSDATLRFERTHQRIWRKQFLPTKLPWIWISPSQIQLVCTGVCLPQQENHNHPWNRSDGFLECVSFTAKKFFSRHPHRHHLVQLFSSTVSRQGNKLGLEQNEKGQKVVNRRIVGSNESWIVIGYGASKVVTVKFMWLQTRWWCLISEPTLTNKEQ